MLQIVIPGKPSIEWWDEELEEFVATKSSKEQIVRLEHSLVSLSKWESKWKKPFISNEKMTEEETIDYIKCMTITQNVPDEAYDNITDEIIEEVTEYINDSMTATWFSKERQGGRSGEVVTSEIIYYWMYSLGIPSEWEKRHLNRLLTLIKVFNIKNTPPKKMSRKEIASKYSSVNQARRKKYSKR